MFGNPIVKRNIPGVIILINAALAALDCSLFKFLIGPYKKGQVYLQCPRQHAYYLRRILRYLNCLKVKNKPYPKVRLLEK